MNITGVFVFGHGHNFVNIRFQIQDTVPFPHFKLWTSINTKYVEYQGRSF